MATAKKNTPAPVAVKARTRVVIALMSSKIAVRPLGKNGRLFTVALMSLIAAQSTLIWAGVIGVYLNALSLIILTLIAVKREDARKLFISLAIIPVANMLVLSLPSTRAFNTAVVYYDAILLLALIYRFIFTIEEPFTNTRLTARGYAFALPLMLVTGQLIGLIGYGFLRHHYPYQNISLPLVAASALVFAFAEEMLMRGLIQNLGSKVLHPITAAALTSVLYLFLAISHVTMLSVYPAALLGIVLSATYYFKQNLILTVTINAAAKLTYIGLIASFILR